MATMKSYLNDSLQLLRTIGLATLGEAIRVGAPRQEAKASVVINHLGHNADRAGDGRLINRHEFEVRVYNQNMATALTDVDLLFEAFNEYELVSGDTTMHLFPENVGLEFDDLDGYQAFINVDLVHTSKL